MLHIGIDEAGYGPLLGPLVIGLSAVRTAPDVAAPEGDPIRRRLGDLLCAAGHRRDAGAPAPLPVPVDDSKLLWNRDGLPGLARAVGALTSAMDQSPPADLDDMLARYADVQPADYAQAPWFRDLRQAAVPGYPWPGPLDAAFRARGVQAVDLRVLPVDAPALNESFARWNKARALGFYSGALLLGVLDRHPAEDAVVVFDRHGGRRDYLAFLGDLFAFAAIDQRASGPRDQHYRVLLPDRSLDVHFVTGGDRRAVTVSWASVAAKLTRELFMRCLNAWFQRRCPALRPTAGYYTDGRRFLEDVEHVIAEEGIARDLLVRAR